MSKPWRWLEGSLLGRGALFEAPFRKVSDRLFRHIEVDEGFAAQMAALAARGPVVYVLRSVSKLDYLALDHLTHRFELPPVAFANDLPATILPRPAAGAANRGEQLRVTLESGRAAALFLKRPPLLDDRGSAEADAGQGLVETLIGLQARRTDEVMLVPLVFVWTQRPERLDFSLVDTLFGPAEHPGEVRRAAQFAVNYQNARVRAGEPLSLRAFVEQQGRHEPTAALRRRLEYALLRKVERERRVIVGPAHKPPDRVREEVLRSPKLQALIREMAGPGGRERALLNEKARTMLSEMQTIPDPETSRGLEMLAGQVLDRVYAGVDVDHEGLERVRRYHAEGSVVLLPSHKSHVDYIVLSYVLHKSGIQLPVIAAGDNLSFFPAGPMLRRAGAFFIRRKFGGDRLYTAVVGAYVRRLLRDGWIIEFFMEGGRSRTGKLLNPMLGLLSMVVSSALGLEGRPVHFVPVAIGYERLMEEGAYAQELSGAKKEKEDATQLLRITRLLADRWGRINIQFGEGIELGALREELELPDQPTPPQQRALVKRVAYQAMSEINRVTALTPGALVALVLLSYGRRGVAYRDLLAHAGRLSSMLLGLGARATPSLVGPDGRQLRERGIREALDTYVKSGLVEQHVPGDTLTAEGRRRAALYAGTDVIFTVPVPKRIRLDLAKNHIIHWLVERSLIAVALLCRPEGSGPDGGPALPREVLRSRVRNLSRLFKYEFAFRTDAPFDVLFDELRADMVERGELVELESLVTLGPGHDDLDGHAWLTFYATVIRNYLEAYRVAARALGALVKGPLEPKDLVARGLRSGERMFLQGEIERSEAVNRPLLVNAIEAFIDQGYVVRVDDRVALADSFASQEAAQAIEARIAGDLRGRADDELWG